MPYSFRRPSLRRIAKIFDLTVLGLAFLSALVISSGATTWPSVTNLLAVRIKVVNLLLLIGYLAFCSFVFSIHGFYRSRRSLQWHERVARIFVALFIAAGALAGLREPFEFSFATDGFLLFFWFLGCLSLILVHETSHILQYIARLHGRQYRNVVIIGEGQRALNLAAHIEEQPTLGYRLLRIISTKENEV